MKNLPPTLKPCPKGGNGVHVWLFYAACVLTEAGIEPEECAKIMEAGMTRPQNPGTEVTDAISAARREDRGETQTWPKRDLKRIHLILKQRAWPLKPTSTSAQDALEMLFPGNPLLCIGKTSQLFATRPRRSWAGHLDKSSLIVPSPMTARTGKTKKGHMSEHSLDNTGPRHYLIIEFDWGTLDGQLKLHQHLANICAPGFLVAIVHSGSKSAHGWYDFRGCEEHQTENFMDYAVSLGADPRLWLRSQFCRLPGGTREDGRPQPVLLFEKKFLQERADFLRKESIICR